MDNRQLTSLEARALARVHVIETELEPIIRKALKRVIARTMKHARIPSFKEADATLTAAVSADSLLILIQEWQTELKNTITPAMRKAYEKAAGWTLRDLPDVVDVRLGENIRDARAVEFIKHSNNRLVGIGDTLHREASMALRTSLENGEGVDKAAARVSQALDVSASRATTIARTESAAVVSGADYAISQELTAAGVEHVRVWLATNDSRTRDSHRLADGQRVPVDQPFIVNGSTLDYPGDPAGPAAEVINCRCAFLMDVDDLSITEQLGGDDAGAPFGQTDVFDPVDGWESLEQASAGHPGGDRALADIIKGRGWTGKPTVLPADEFEAAARESAEPVLYRGLRSSHGTSAARLHDDFLFDDDPFVGRGIYGNGYYFSEDKAVVDYYSQGPDSVIKAVFKPGARVGRYSELFEQYNAEWDAIDWDNYAKDQPRISIIDDFGRWAAIQGYDAYYGQEHLIVLNRGALAVSEERGSGN